MKRRLPLAATAYVITLIAFMVLWGGITLVQARADKAWEEAGNAGLQSEQQGLATLLEHATERPWTLQELSEWTQQAYPRLKYAVYDSDGELITSYGAQELPRVDPRSVEWSDANLVVLDDGVEVSRYAQPDGRWRYVVTRYVLSPGQWRVTYIGYAVGIAMTGLLWLAVAILFGRLFAVPLRNMTQTAAELSAGNFAARTNIDRADELGVLAQSLDQMADRLGGMLEAQQVLMAQVSHELRTPLARLRVAVDLAEVSSGEEARREVLEMSDDLLELETLVSDVLALARLDVAVARGSDRGSLRPDTLELSTWIPSVVERFARTHPQRPLSHDVDPSLPSIAADRALLGRVLMNLLTNADKYSPSSAPIHVTVTRSEERIDVVVRDEGPGIAEDDLQRVFEPFFRGREAQDSTTGGHGLGLSLCRRAARFYDGDITLRNRPEGGTEAHLWLPVSSPKSS